MLNKDLNEKIKVQEQKGRAEKRNIAVILIFLFFLMSVALFAEEQGGSVPEKYGFKLYVLAKGTMKMKVSRPDFGWRVIKAFPLKVKEYTYPAPYMDSASPVFKAAAEKILMSVDELRRKNAVRVADAVFNYVDSSITARDAVEETAENPHRVYFSAQQVLNEGKANILEKCRLSCAMLRYFSIPARIVSRQGHYETEYYLQPLSEKGKGAWYLHDFAGEGPQDGEMIVPADWHPIDAKELLREEWKNPMFIKLIQQKRRYLYGDDPEANDSFNALTQTGKPAGEDIRPGKGSFHVIDVFEYELWLDPGVKQARAEFTLPFNLQNQADIRDDFKTVKYFVESKDERLAVKAKWPQTMTKPSVEGIIYTLPVDFTVGQGL